MTKILLILSIIISLGYSFNEDFDQKFCDKNLPDSKIAEFENCEQFVPKGIIDNSNSCLKELNLGTNYRDFRNTICDSKLRKKYITCHKNKMRTQKVPETTTEMSEGQVEMFRNHETCMRKALGVKDES